jgi:hypothetical protein
MGHPPADELARQNVPTYAGAVPQSEAVRLIVSYSGLGRTRQEWRLELDHTYPFRAPAYRIVNRNRGQCQLDATLGSSGPDSSLVEPRSCSHGQTGA